MKNNQKFGYTITHAPTENLWNKVWLEVKELLYHESIVHQVEKLDGVKSILEVGAGSGADLLELKKRGYDVTFSDFSAVAIENVLKKDSKVKIVKCDARDLPFENNRFDLVYCLGLLEHFSEEDRKKIISEHFRVSSKYVLLDVPQSYTITSIVKYFLMAIGKWKYGDEIVFSFNKLNNEVKMSACTDAKLCTVYGRELIPLPRNLKNKLFMRLSENMKKKYVSVINKFYFLSGSLGLIYKK